MQKVHNSLAKRYKKYQDWHKNPSAPAVHWVLLLAVVVGMGFLFYLRLSDSNGGSYGMSSRASGNNWYVAVTGSSNNTGSIDSPWNLAHAVAGAGGRVQPGDTIHVRGGVYPPVTMTVSGSSSAYVTLTGYQGEVATMTPQFKSKANYVVITKLVFEGNVPSTNNVYIYDSHHIVFTKNEIRNGDWHAGLSVDNVNNMRITRNYIHSNGIDTSIDHGVYFKTTSGGGNVIANNLIVNNAARGISLHDNSGLGGYDILVVNNTIINNGSTGILSNDGDRHHIINNISAYNGSKTNQSQIRILHGDNSEARNNLTYSTNSSKAGIENTTLSQLSGNIIAEPSLVAMGTNWRLSAGSPAVDRGINVSTYNFVPSFDGLVTSDVTADYDEGARPQGSAYDIGAFEYGSSTPTPGDTTPPSTSITSPAAGARLSGTVAVTAQASDNVGVTKVEFLRNGQVFATDTSSPYSASWDTLGQANGTYNLQSKAYDGAGNVGSSDSVAVTVDNAAQQSRIGLSVSTMYFSGVSGGTTPPAKSLTLSNLGQVLMGWSATSNQNWCTATPTSGSLASGASSSVSIVMGAPSNVGTFNCDITFAAANADNTPQVLRITYVVTAPQTVTYKSTHDAMIDSRRPNSTNGKGSGFGSDLNNNILERLGLVKFNVTGSTNPTRAILRLYVTDSSSGGITVHKSGVNWTESTVTWNNQPAYNSTALANISKTSSRTYIELDVTSAISGSGEYSFVIKGRNDDSAYFSAKEGRVAPQLILYY